MYVFERFLSYYLITFPAMKTQEGKHYQCGDQKSYANTDVEVRQPGRILMNTQWLIYNSSGTRSVVCAL